MVSVEEEKQLYMKNNSILSDENKRKIYVGITRAKSNLFIHYNDNIFILLGEVNEKFRIVLQSIAGRIEKRS